jgi:hypothetical protein
MKSYFNCFLKVYLTLIKKSSYDKVKYFSILGIEEPVSYKPKDSSSIYIYKENYFINILNKEIEKLNLKSDGGADVILNIVAKINNELKFEINQLLLELNKKLDQSIINENVQHYEDYAIFRRIFNIIFSIVLFFYLCYKLPNTNEDKYPIRSALLIVLGYNVIFFIGSYLYKKNILNK